VDEIVRVSADNLSQSARVVDFKTVLSDMRSSAMSRYMGAPVRIADYTTASVTMATAFNRRKAADNWRRTSVAKTGSLDTLRMNQYKWNEDIFRRTTRIADGKNHGIVILLDWSSSMSPIMQSTIGQLFILADFCRKVGVPFEVYAFSDQRSGVGCRSEASQERPTRHPRCHDAELPVLAHERCGVRSREDLPVELASDGYLRPPLRAQRYADHCGSRCCC
jgi:hypothetical protein